MFLLPHPKDVSCDGSSDEQPLFLLGVCKVAFRRLLMAMKFPTALGWSNPGNDEVSNSQTARIYLQEWASVLELTCMWQMAKVRETVVVEKILPLLCRVSSKDLISLLTLSDKLGILEIRNQLVEFLSTHLPSVKLVEIGVELPVYSLLIKGYAQLVTQGISMETQELLGRKTTSKLFRMRDQYLRCQWNVHTIPDIYRFVTAQLTEELKDAIWQ
jgi:hypothetical protein